jgi:hypothetical protein
LCSHTFSRPSYVFAQITAALAQCDEGNTCCDELYSANDKLAEHFIAFQNIEQALDARGSSGDGAAFVPPRQDEECDTKCVEAMKTEVKKIQAAHKSFQLSLRRSLDKVSN